MLTIDSPKNDRIKEIRKLQQKKYREQTGTFLLEGWHSLKEALHSDQATVLTILAIPAHWSTINTELAQSDVQSNVIELVTISQRVAEALRTTTTTDGYFAVLRLPQLDGPESDQLERPWLVLDHVQDPGNAGTMVRTADAAGFAGVVFSEGAIDPWNSKTIRSMQGSEFHLPVVTTADVAQWLQTKKAQGYRLLGTLVDQSATDIRQCHLDDPRYCLVMGNEAHGLTPSLATQMDMNLYLPIFGQAESLNVAIAAAVLMYQLQLQVKD